MAKKSYRFFEKTLEASNLPPFKREFLFAQEVGRKWRFDYAWPQYKLALEIEGGSWVNGRHNRASGFIADMGKYNQAAFLGWKILRVTPKDVDSGYARTLMEKYFKLHPNPEGSNEPVQKDLF